jgi:hypothetical protein
MEGTNRSGKLVSLAIEGEELARHLMHRARRGALPSRRMKVTGFAAAPA